MSFQSFAMSLKIDSDLTDGLLLLQLEGRLDGNSAPALGRAIGEKLPEDCTQVVLDLGLLSFISSAGLRELMVLAQKLDRRGKSKAVVSGVQPAVAEVLEISGMSALFKPAATVAEARRLAAGGSAKGGFLGRLFSGAKS